MRLVLPFGTKRQHQRLAECRLVPNDTHAVAGQSQPDFLKNQYRPPTQTIISVIA